MSLWLTWFILRGKGPQWWWCAGGFTSWHDRNNVLSGPRPTVRLDYGKESNLIQPFLDVSSSYCVQASNGVFCLGLIIGISGRVSWAAFHLPAILLSASIHLQAWVWLHPKSIESCQVSSEWKILFRWAELDVCWWTEYLTHLNSVLLV